VDWIAGSVALLGSRPMASSLLVINGMAGEPLAPAHTPSSSPPDAPMRVGNVLPTASPPAELVCSWGSRALTVKSPPAAGLSSSNVYVAVACTSLLVHTVH